MPQDRRDIDRTTLAHAARVCRTNADAAAALNLSKAAFSTRCRRAGIETLFQRHRRHRAAEAAA